VPGENLPPHSLGHPLRGSFPPQTAIESAYNSGPWKGGLTMSAQNMQPTDNKQIVQRFIDECWNQGNLNTVSELLADDCRYHDPVFPSLTSGAENIKNHIQTCRNGFPDLMFTTDDTIAERNEVVIHWTGMGTHKGQFLGMPPTNKKATVTGTSIYRIEDGKIAEQWASWNLMSMMEQLGIAMATAAPSNVAQANAAQSNAAQSKAPGAEPRVQA
jgi:steroid delta-isomerase-like uncharacterized protein